MADDSRPGRGVRTHEHQWGSDGYSSFCNICGAEPPSPGHDDDCEADWIDSAGGWSECGCNDRHR